MSIARIKKNDLVIANAGEYKGRRDASWLWIRGGQGHR